MKKFLAGALLALFVVIGSTGFSSVASSEDPGDSGIGIVKKDDDSGDGNLVVEPESSEDPGDSGIG